MTMALLIVILVMAILVGIATQRVLSLRRQLMHERQLARTSLDELEATVKGRAIASERERIYNDLHDDLGASLLHLVYTAQSPEQADAVRSVLQNLRDVVTRSRGTPGTLGDVLGDIRDEATQRLAAVDIELKWIDTDDLPDPILGNETALHLHRIVREAISNVIRHAQARCLRIRIDVRADRLGIELTDDGSGESLGQVEGSGKRSMRERADEIAGDIDWRSGTQGGTKVLLNMPLTPARQ